MDNLTTKQKPTGMVTEFLISKTKKNNSINSQEEKINNRSVNNNLDGDVCLLEATNATVQCSGIIKILNENSSQFRPLYLGKLSTDNVVQINMERLY